MTGVHWIDKEEEAIRGKGHIMCKGLKAERAYNLDKAASSVVTMAVTKTISETAEEGEVAEDSQIMKRLVFTTKWFYPVGTGNVIKPMF